MYRIGSCPSLGLSINIFKQHLLYTLIKASGLTGLKFHRSILGMGKF